MCISAVEVGYLTKWFCKFEAKQLPTFLVIMQHQLIGISWLVPFALVEYLYLFPK